MKPVKPYSICFVVHRYAPFPGGSEYYVQAMAEECYKRGYLVTVLTSQHAGDLNGVHVTSDFNILVNEIFDLIVVHGADVYAQNVVLINKDKIKSRCMYMIILPSNSNAAVSGMRNCEFLAYSTTDDFNHITKNGYFHKAVKVRHSLPNPMQDCIGVPGFFKKKYDIKTPHMILSCGGYWPNKGMHELAATFRSLGLIDTTLVTTGYANAQDAPKECEFVRSIILDDRREVYNAMADADLYVMNSTQEGFGLVLLEAMANQLPWAARDIAGATELKQWGFTYTRQEELADFIKLTFSPRSVPPDAELLYMAKEYVSEQRQITNTVDDIEAVLKRPR